MARTPEPAAPTSGPRLNLPIFLLALFGGLVVVHLWVQLQANFVYGCTGVGSAATAAGCAEVTSSIYSTFLGVSVLVWGGLFYLAIAALRFAIVATRPPTSETLRTASLAVVSAGFLFALYLVSVQFFMLEQFCTLCLVSSLTTATLFVLHVVERVMGPAPTPESASGAGPMGAALRPYAIAAAVVVVLAGTDVLITRSADAPVPVSQTADSDGSVQAAVAAGGISAECRYDVEVPRFRNFDRLLTMETPYVGSADASVRVVKIFDPNCPHCKTLHQQLESVIPQLEDEARFYYKPYPIWDHSIPQVQALYLAGEEGKFFEMLDLQFENQQVFATIHRQDLGEEEVLAGLTQLGEEIGMDPEYVRNEIEARKYVGLIRQQNQLIQETGIRSVPKLVIEGRVVASTRESFTAECIGGLIELAAKEKGGASTASSSPAPPATDS